MSKKRNKIEKPIDSIFYSGKVTLKLEKGNKILKTLQVNNLGTSELLRGLALYLNDNGGDNPRTPKYLDVGTSNEISSSTVVETHTDLVSSLLGENRVSLEPRAIEEIVDNNIIIGWVAPFEATIPYSSILGSTVREIGLFSAKTGGYLLSRIVVNDIQVPQGFNLIVRWEIAIENKKEGNE